MKNKNIVLYGTLALIALAFVGIFYWFKNNDNSSVKTGGTEPTPTTIQEAVARSVARGDELFNAAKYEEAFRAYNTAIENDVELAGAYAGRGNIYMIRRHFPEAARDFSESLKYLETAEVFANRCNAYRMTQDYELAKADCEAALQLDPNSLDGHLSSAMLQLDQGNTTEAKVTIDNLLTINPEQSEAYMIHSQIALAENNPEEAIEMLSKAIEINPTEPQYYWDRGFLYYVSGKVSEAKEDMQKVLDYGTPETDGELLLKAGTLLSSLEGVE